MEVIKLENYGHYQDEMIMPSDIFLLQVCHSYSLSTEIATFYLSIVSQNGPCGNVYEK